MSHGEVFVKFFQNTSARKTNIFIQNIFLET